MSKAKPIHAHYCFDVLSNYLTSNQKSNYKDKDVDKAIEDLPGLTALNDLFPDESYPLFVTWNTNERNMEELRGCIGNFSPMSLHSGLKEYALISGLRDPRFPPIQKSEFPNLTCSVSLLVDFEEASDCFDWAVGKHGIRINFEDEDGGNCSSTYLPEVAGWDRREALESLLRKGGFRGKVTETVLAKVKLTRYQSHKVKVSYPEYLDFINGRSV